MEAAWGGAGSSGPGAVPQRPLERQEQGPLIVSAVLKGRYFSSLTLSLNAGEMKPEAWLFHGGSRAPTKKDSRSNSLKTRGCTVPQSVISSDLKAFCDANRLLSDADPAPDYTWSKTVRVNIFASIGSPPPPHAPPPHAPHTHCCPRTRAAPSRLHQQYTMLWAAVNTSEAHYFESPGM